MSVILMNVLLSGCEKISSLITGKGSIETLDPTNVTWDDMTMQGKVSTDLLAGGVSVGFIVSEGTDCTPETGRVIPVDQIAADGSYSALADGLAWESALYYRAYLNDGEYRMGDVKRVVAKTYEFGQVDLGLSVMWANANVGGLTLFSSGDHYAWGEVTVKMGFTWAGYKWSDGAYDQLKKYNGQNRFGVVDGKVQLEEADDAAHFKLRGSWRMPTADEIKELVDTYNSPDYKWEWKTVLAKEGYKVTCKTNGNSIFLPASGTRKSASEVDGEGVKGYYWSSSIPNTSYVAVCLVFEAGKAPEVTNEERYQGFTIRAVTDK